MNLQTLLQGSSSVFLFILRILTPLLAIWVVCRCYSSLRRGRRREDPVVILEDRASHAQIPVLYWENSIGRSKSCDIILPDDTASRDHAVLMRRESGWIITDTDSKAGTFVNGKKAAPSLPVLPGDSIAMGSTALILKRVGSEELKARKSGLAETKKAPSPFRSLLLVNMIHLFLALQLCFAGKTFSFDPFVPFAGVTLLSWSLYWYSIKGLHRVSFELETIGFLLSGIGILLLFGASVQDAYIQMAAMLAGVVLFCLMIPFMGNLDRVTKWRPAIAIFAVLLFAVNLLFGIASHGSKNWIALGPVSVQPSEFIKIAFVFVGASTLDRLQTKKNLGEFILFSGVCIGALFLMKDFGTACIFFVTFLIIAFMRSGSIRTIVLILAAAVFGVFIILQFKPYIAERFAAWRHVWEYADSTGYQQTRVLTYAASGGAFGTGLGKGCLKSIFASTSDLVFGMLCEETGLLLALCVVLAIAALSLYARSDVTRSRSTFYSITACAAAGLMLFQTCLNVFGSTDILPLTGVTLPFISAGGSSMAACWGLLAFLKASDERTYAARRRTS